MISWFSSCDTIIVTWLARFWSIIGLTLNVIFHNSWFFLNHKIRVHYIKPTPALSCLTVTHQNVRLLAKKALKWILEKHSIEKRPLEARSKISRRIFWIKNFANGSKERKKTANGSWIDRSWTESGSEVDQNGLKFRKKNSMFMMVENVRFNSDELIYTCQYWWLDSM